MKAIEIEGRTSNDGSLIIKSPEYLRPGMHVRIILLYEGTEVSVVGDETEEVSFVGLEKQRRLIF